MCGAARIQAAVLKIFSIEAMVWILKHVSYFVHSSILKHA